MSDSRSFIYDVTQQTATVMKFVAKAHFSDHRILLAQIGDNHHHPKQINNGKV